MPTTAPPSPRPQATTPRESRAASSENIALVYQPFRTETREAAERCRDLIERYALSAELLPAFELQRSSSGDRRLVLTFGGDGTVLRAAAWLLGTGVPIVPLRMGKLSFLAELEVSDLPNALPFLLDGRYRIDERIMVEARCGDVAAVGLNEVIVGRGAASRAVRVDVYVDGALLTRYTSDGVVVATPTGSTAYALAAGGPVLAPSLQALSLVPVAPHITQLRALVLPATAEIRLVTHTVQPAVLTVDGHLDLPVADGQEVQVRVSRYTTRFARLADESEFYRLLEARLSRRS